MSSEPLTLELPTPVLPVLAPRAADSHKECMAMRW